MAAAHAPGLDLPVGALQHADHVHQPALADRVVDEVRRRCDPLRHPATQHVGQPVRGRDAAPCDAAGEAGTVFAEQAIAQQRMDAVGADERIALRGRAILEFEPDAMTGLPETHHACADVNGVGLEATHRVEQHRLQVRAMHGVVPEAVALADTVVVDCVQVMTLELLAVTVGVLLLLVTVTLAVDVQPLLWVTDTVYVPAVLVLKLEVV